MDVEKILNELTLHEKAELVSGTNFMYTKNINRLSVPSIRMSDGPHGLRVQNGDGDNGVTASEKATAFPTASTVSCSWNIENAKRIGIALAEESLFYNVNLILGPGVNIKRNPLAGRNFEYYSEDPLLSGKLASSEVQGIQSKGIGACVKHFALNNQENYRFLGNSICDERAIREIYLKPFEIIVKEAKPHAIMCSYNKINNIYCTENKWLLNDILRNEWGFNGLVMTDWGGTHARLKMLEAGCDLEMPGDTSICKKWIVENGENEYLDKACKNVLNLVNKYQNQKKEEVDFNLHHILAQEISEDSAVLLKNNGLLPLNNNEKYLIVGELFEKMRYQGAGSSMINPCFLVSPKDAFDQNNINYEYVKGYKENKLETDSDLLSLALNKAKDYKTIVVFLGLTDYVESEGEDRKNMSLPQNQIDLMNELIKLKKQIVVVLYNGSIVELPFEKNVDAILDMFLPGQNGGNATYSLLFGKKSPSGKLSSTWVKKYDDVPYGKKYSQNEIELYKESIFVGYRYYLSKNKDVLYPFGYGLSYTKFSYSNLSIEIKEKIIVKCLIKNIGNFDGAEIAQLYVKKLNSSVFRPIKELKGFSKIYLKQNEEKLIEIILDINDLAYYNVQEKRFVVECGKYDFEICSDAETCKLHQEIYIKGENLKCPYLGNINNLYSRNIEDISNEEFETFTNIKIPEINKKLTLESRFTDLKNSFIGRILYNAVLSVAKKELKEAKKMPESSLKDNKIKGAIFLKRILESNSLITMSMSAGKSFPYNFAQGFVDLGNGHIFKGIKDFCCKIKEE